MSKEKTAWRVFLSAPFTFSRELLRYPGTGFPAPIGFIDPVHVQLPARRVITLSTLMLIFLILSFAGVSL